MTPNELYKLEPESISNDLNDLNFGSYGRIFPEIEELGCGYWFNEYDQTDISIRCYKNFDFDGRRYWKLSAVYLKDEPVMVVQCAGREGDDHTQRFITDKELFKLLIVRIQEIMLELSDEDEFDDLIDGDKYCDISSFYGNSLNDHFERY